MCVNWLAGHEFVFTAVPPGPRTPSGSSRTLGRICLWNQHCSPHLAQERPPHAPSDSEFLWVALRTALLLHLFCGIPEAHLVPAQGEHFQGQQPWMSPPSGALGCSRHAGSPLLDTKSEPWEGSRASQRPLPAEDLAQGAPRTPGCSLLLPRLSRPPDTCPSASLRLPGLLLLLPRGSEPRRAFRASLSCPIARGSLRIDSCFRRNLEHDPVLCFVFIPAFGPALTGKPSWQTPATFLRVLPQRGACRVSDRAGVRALGCEQ